MCAAAATLALGIAGPLGASQPVCERELVVLGAGQDAGAPQIGNANDAGPRLLPSSLALIDREDGKRYLFDATPAITQQLAMLDRIESPPKGGLGVDGIFLTHAHIGHYMGLAYFGREAAGPDFLPVYALPRMFSFLRENGPWNQLVELQNIELFQLQPGALYSVSDTFGVWSIPVPHRDEYSETAGYIIITPGKTAVYVPDIDSWEAFEEQSGDTLENQLAAVDYAFVDATFWDDGELEGRDMREVPHPRVKQVMDRLAGLPSQERAKVHFIHYNHTNPIRDPDSPQSALVEDGGFNVARRGDRLCLD